MSRIARFAFACSLVAGASAASPPTLPDYAPLPAGVAVKDGRFARYDEVELDLGGGKKELERGKRWGLYFFTDDLHAKDVQEAWEKFKAPLLARGWTVIKEPARGEATLHYRKKGTEAFLRLQPGNSDGSLDLVELGTGPATLTLAEPAATPETVDPATGDFPYLAPWPESTYGRGGRDPQPILVPLPGSDKAEAVGSGSIVKTYRSPPDISNLDFTTAYAAALGKAGWTIVARAQGPHQGDCWIIAHYQRRGRNLWARLNYRPSREYAIQVADVGDLGSLLGKECHATLHGVFFDFDKATLKQESDPVLAAVAELVARVAPAKLEIQGHTDAVGDAAYNQTLSEARARAVVAWLVAHGAKADRLEAKGYGKTQPVADNATDEGRARNRRVEIADPSCKRQ